MTRTTQFTLERFEDRFEPEPTSGCWLWIRSARDGYGSFCGERKIIPAHRFSYEYFHGPVPADLVVNVAFAVFFEANGTTVRHIQTPLLMLVVYLRWRPSTRLGTGGHDIIGLSFDSNGDNTFAVMDDVIELDEEARALLAVIERPT